MAKTAKNTSDIKERGHQSNRQNQTVSDISNFSKSTKTVVLKTIQLATVRKQTEFMNPNKIRQYKIKGGSKFSKIWENSCSCNRVISYQGKSSSISASSIYSSLQKDRTDRPKEPTNIDMITKSWDEEEISLEDEL